MPLLDVTDLRTHFHTRGGVYRAVDGVSFSVERGETLGIVGESGSGKSVTCYSLMGLVPQPPGRIASGRALFDGTDLLHCSPAEARAIRGKRIAMIFQDPSSCLNPVHRIGWQLVEALRLHRGLHGKAAEAEALRLLDQVGIADARRRLQDYPHLLSGGLNQRVMIAMALAGQPDLLVADEPTTALDATIQAQILALLSGIRRDTGMALVLISHDLGVVAENVDRVAVMYAGRLVEEAPGADLFGAARHPYTQGLLAALPSLTGPRQRLAAIPGTVPDPWNVPAGCRFAPRCPVAETRCASVPPPARSVGFRHVATCHRQVEAAYSVWSLPQAAE